MDKKVKIPEESIYKTDEENMGKIFFEMRKYITKLEYLVQQQQVLIRNLENMLMSNSKIPFNPEWFEGE